MQKKGKELKQWLNQNIKYGILIMLILLILVLIYSYLVPKKVIDTYKTNVTEDAGDTEKLLPLEDETIISYQLNTGTRPMVGIHVGVSKNGGGFLAGSLLCNVYVNNNIVSQNTYLLNQGEDLQYVYIPFSNYEKCVGNIEIQFSYDKAGNTTGEFPSLLANGKHLERVSTLVNQVPFEGNLKTIYIYTHDTYPLVYDLRILVVLCLAGFLLCTWKEKKQSSKEEIPVLEKTYCKKRYNKSITIKKIVVSLGILLGTIVLGFLIEILVFHYQGFGKEVEHITFKTGENGNDVYQMKKTEEDVLIPLSESERNNIVITRENEALLAKVNNEVYAPKEDSSLVEDGSNMYRKKVKTTLALTFPNQMYVDHFSISYPELTKNCDYNYIFSLDGKEHYVGTSTLDYRIGTGIQSIREKADSATLILVTDNKIEGNQLTVQATNENGIHYIRVLFLIGCIWLIGLFVIGVKRNNNLFSEKPEIIFVFASLVMGCMLILAIGTNQVSYDEHVHAARAYDISFGSTIQTTETAMEMKGNNLPYFHSLGERALVEQYETKQNDFSWANITTQSRFIAYNDRSYLPIAFLFKVSRVLGLSFATMIMLGKFGNLLLFTGISYLAIKYAKIGKPLIAILALLPHIMFAATAITYDGVVNAFLLLAVVLTTNIIVEREKPLLWWQGLVLLGVYIGGSTAKPIYMIMSLMLLFLPNKKFPNKIQAYLFRVCVVVLTGLMLYTVFFPPVSTSSSYELMNNLAYAGDKRNQGTSVLGQIQYIIANPIAYTKLLLTSIFGEFWNYVSGKRPFLLYGYLGSLNKYMNIACVLLLGFAALIGPKDQERNTIGIKYKGLNLLMVFGLTAIIWTSMYISYTAVGNPVIEGVQARYFIPLLLPFGYCLYHTKWRCPLKKHTYYTILFAFVIALNVVATYTLALKPLNF